MTVGGFFKLLTKSTPLISGMFTSISIKSICSSVNTSKASLALRHPFTKSINGTDFAYSSICFSASGSSSIAIHFIMLLFLSLLYMNLCHHQYLRCSPFHKSNSICVLCYPDRCHHYPLSPSFHQFLN